MNEQQLHKMIRTFVGYGAPDHKDDTGANKPDYPFFNRLAHQDTLDMKDMVEASERFYKYRNTQLPTSYGMQGWVTMLLNLFHD